MGAIVLFDPEMVKGCNVKLVDDAMLESATTAEWSVVGSIHADDGTIRFVLSRPRQANAARNHELRSLLAKAFHAGAAHLATAHKSKVRLTDPEVVSAAETYARSVGLGDTSSG
jgi:hypothetical protein